ncbi:endonuclease/exonuclease/phosphatase family protein [Solitalea sp. MAHUQ-68]|uniref:Endonuclease/exonuclease/phosphatase family protein n=1 Tax=Solitalea agri TaxID=2953739 RepID=A0A9X2JCU1_9SPHI|nr:endonuclease/exonuclease/phosphatase family protein [Solitalea agri]MCO4292150.1 endonuclease/exonuclease/phosphatase family protein [Solitalea agri]
MKIKNLFNICMLSILSLGFSTSKAQDLPRTELTIATYNIRLNVASDSINAWPNRKDWVKELIQYHQFDIFGVQEALNEQMVDLDELPGFDYVGVGRDDGKQAGEYSAIFYNTRKFSVLKTGTFWLSPTPEKPSKGWDAAIVRICTWACFSDVKTGKLFYVFNTHFDHIGVKARENSAKLILEKIEDIVPPGTPVIAMGDFNSTPETSAFKTMNTNMADAREVTKAKPYGPIGTFNNFNYNSDLKDRIDYIFVNSKVEVLKYGVLSDAKDKRFPSDHLPIVCRIVLN